MWSWGCGKLYAIRGKYVWAGLGTAEMCALKRLDALPPPQGFKMYYKKYPDGSHSTRAIDHAPRAMGGTIMGSSIRGQCNYLLCAIGGV